MSNKEKIAEIKRILKEDFNGGVVDTAETFDNWIDISTIGESYHFIDELRLDNVRLVAHFEVEEEV